MRIVLHKAEPEVYEETRYIVNRDDVQLGIVCSIRSNSWRMHGRLRTSLRGRPKRWHVYQHGRYHLHPVTRCAYTRGEAVRLLIERVDEKEDE